VRFRCGACGTVLTLPESKAGASGPCPRCGTWIDATLFHPHGTPIPALPVAPAADAGRSTRGAKARGSRIRADGFLDHEYNERKELYKTLRVLAFFVAVAAVVLVVTVYMRTWMLK
jgi:phage FluMu protein Com